MNYIEYTFNIQSEEQADILVAQLADMGFESFSEWESTKNHIQGYISVDLGRANKVEIEEFMATVQHTSREIEQQNWNALWESNFEPIIMGDKCTIRAPFHAPIQGVGYDIVIMPKMSFGTGHHPTTYLMVEAVLDLRIDGRIGLDMGSGTGILAILAAMRGAKRVDAIDIDEWAWENCNENAALNGMQDRVVAQLGDASLLEERDAEYDFILANINRNILLRDMPKYIRSLKSGGEIVFSGILEFDVAAISEAALGNGLTLGEVYLEQGWASIRAAKL